MSATATSVLSCKVKWNKESLSIDINPMEGLLVLKAQLMACTNVPVDRQRLLVKGKQLKEDADLFKLKNVCRLIYGRVNTGGTVDADGIDRDGTRNAK